MGGPWREKLDELVRRPWDKEAIRLRLNNMRTCGFVRKTADSGYLKAHKAEIVERVKSRAEEYEYLTHSCAKGSALALMEEFGLGSWDMVKALSPFPGFGMTGGICGGVTGGLIGIGLYFGGEAPEDYQATGNAMTAARKFISRFKEELGSIICPDIHEGVIFGRYMDPRASQENFEAFQRAQGYERCALPAGIGAGLAAEVIIDGA